MQLVDGNFATSELLVAALKAAAIDEGFNIVIRDHKIKNKILIMQCDRAGERRVRKSADASNCLRQRNTGSKKANCKYRINCSFNSTGTWIHRVSFSEHSHDLGDVGPATFNTEQMEIVSKMVATGSNPRVILSDLHASINSENAKRIIVPNFTQILPNSRQVHNAVASARKKLLQNHSPMDALLNTLIEDETIHFVRKDQDGVATGLFFIFPQSIKLAHAHSHVLVMDCTYQTNKYKMPLFHIVGQVCYIE
jgi:hypothetical protein